MINTIDTINSIAKQRYTSCGSTYCIVYGRERGREREREREREKQTHTTHAHTRRHTRTSSSTKLPRVPIPRIVPEHQPPMTAVLVCFAGPLDCSARFGPAAPAAPPASAATVSECVRVCMSVFVCTAAAIGPLNKHNQTGTDRCRSHRVAATTATTTRNRIHSNVIN